MPVLAKLCTFILLLVTLAGCDSDAPPPSPTFAPTSIANPTQLVVDTPLPEATATQPQAPTATLDGGVIPERTVTVEVALPTATSASSAAIVTPVSCIPTREDGEGPFYVPNAPERTSVGEGHMLRGVVRSSRDCSALTGARLEFWQVGPDAQYDDDHRATLFSDPSGAYSFESNFPPGYSGRPPHIHVRATAEGHNVLITQYYPQQGETDVTFDLVLVP